MVTAADSRDLRVFSTCPSRNGATAESYLARVASVARWSEEAGYRGILIYTDHSQLDPWLVAQAVIQATRAICPLVAVQPAYMHPYSVAKLVTSLGFLSGRQVYLNMVAGGFTNDLKALHDPTPHDQRYHRLVEYTTIIQRLLDTPGPVSFAGDFYTVTNLKLSPPLAAGLRPGVLVSGSSVVGLASAKTLGATAIVYPTKASDETNLPASDSAWGIRVGVLARGTDEEAWQVARARFPDDRKGQLAHELAMKVSDSTWHQTLSARAGESADGVYWLWPFEHYQTMCPYLVGSYARVAEELTRYFQRGCATVILDEPPDREECRHTARAFELASTQVAI